jgi:4-aminobutyrate aminotransferase
MLGSEFVLPDGEPNPAAAVRAQQEAAGQGLLLLTCGPFGNVVRMIQPLVVTEEHVQEALAIWSAAVEYAVTA